MVKRIMSKLCSCGCGKEVTWNRYSKQYNNFISGHSSRGKISPRKGQKVSDETRLKMRLAQLGKKQSEELKRKLSSIRKGILKGRPHSLEHSLKISKSKKEKKFKYSEESKLKMSIAQIGKKLSKEHKLKISLSNKGREFSEEHKSNLSISTINRIERQIFNGGLACPCIGNNEILILNRIQIESGEEILRNDHDLAMKVGKFPDGYIEKYNLCVEVLEPFHFKPTGELSDNDQKRELRIACKLNCMIYYIPEQEFLSNPNKEIQRFKDFLLLLKEESN